MARKNGKTGLVAPIALYGLMLEGEGAEVYSCAADREQAGLIFGAAKRTVEMDPDLSSRLKLYRNVIEYPATGSIYRTLSSEAYTKEGLSPTLVLADELHAWPDRDLYDVMALSMGARVDPLMLIVTTAGVRSDSSGQDSIAYTLWQYGSRVAAGEVVDPSFFMAWWAARDDAPLDDIQGRMDANPGLGDILDPAELAGQAMKAQTGAMEESEYRIKRTNCWVNSSTAALPTGLFEKLGSQAPILLTDPQILFFDGSFNHDCTTILTITVEAKPRMEVLGCWERPLDNPQWRVPMGEVDLLMRTEAGRRNTIEIACDPFRWPQPMEEWAASGLPIAEFATSSPSRMVPAWAKFKDATFTGGYSHDGDPRLVRHVSNLVIFTDRLGPRPKKEHRGSPRSIDLAICAIGGYDRATWHLSQPAVNEPQFGFGAPR